MSRRLVLILLAWLGLLGGAAAAEPLPTYEIVCRDGRFSPSRIEVPAGKRVKLVLKNEGPGPLEFENDEMHIEKILGPGGTSFVVLPPLKPGQYDFIDEFNIATGELNIIVK